MSIFQNNMQYFLALIENFSFHEHVKNLGGTGIVDVLKLTSWNFKTMTYLRIRIRNTNPDPASKMYMVPYDSEKQT
jgi:hypothetical protein